MMRIVADEPQDGTVTYTIDPKGRIIKRQAQHNVSEVTYANRRIIGSATTTPEAVNRYDPESFSPRIREDHYLVFFAEDGPYVSCSKVETVEYIRPR